VKFADEHPELNTLEIIVMDIGMAQAMDRFPDDRITSGAYKRTAEWLKDAEGNVTGARFIYTPKHVANYWEGVAYVATIIAFLFSSFAWRAAKKMYDQIRYGPRA
jgi:uncharacterized membrane protein